MSKVVNSRQQQRQRQPAVAAEDVHVGVLHFLFPLILVANDAFIVLLQG